MDKLALIICLATDTDCKEVLQRNHKRVERSKLELVLNKVKLRRDISGFLAHERAEGDLTACQGERNDVVLLDQRDDVLVPLEGQQIQSVIAPVQEIGGNDAGLFILPGFMELVIATSGSAEGE